MGHATRPRRRDGRTRLTIYGLPLALMAVAAVWRLWLLGHVYTNVDSDQAIIGVMAYHIQAGHHPLMYAGQPYQGSLEAYAAALLFALCGASDWTLRLPVLACAVLFVGAVYALGATLYGRRVAAISAVVVALGPGALLYYGDVTGFGYSEVMLLGTLLLILQARHPDPRAMPLRVALVMGLVAGLGAWIEPLMAEYLLPLGLAYARPLLTIRRGPCARMAPARPLAAIALGAIVGGAPLLAYNLRHHWATLSYLVAQGGQRVDHLGAVTRLVTESLPVLLGLAVPNSNHGAFISLSARYPVQRAVGVAAGLYLLGRFVPALPRRIAALLTDQTVADGSSSRQTPRARKPRDGALALFAASGLLFFMGTHFGAGDSAIDTARYLLPLYTATPLVVDLLVPRQPTRRATGATLLILAALVATNMALARAIPQDLAPRGPVGGLIRALEAQGVRVVYTNYWISYQLTFESRGRVLSIPVNGSRLARVRMLGDLAVAAATPGHGLAWAFAAGAPGARSFQRLLRRTRTRADHIRWANLVIYDHLSRPVRAADPYENAGAPWFEETLPIHRRLAPHLPSRPLAAPPRQRLCYRSPEYSDAADNRAIGLPRAARLSSP